MARIYGEIAASGLMTFDKSFSRSNGQPLDSTELFYSLVAAQEYAQTDVAYVGQKIVVVETVEEVTTVTHYGIEADGSLKELGAIPVGDGVTVEVVDGKIQLADLKDHTTGTYQPYLVDGKIEWRVPSATTVEGLDSRLTTAEDDIDALEGIVGHAASEGVEASGLVKAVAENAAAIEELEDMIGEVTEDKTVVEMIADAQAAATYDDTALAGRVSDAEDGISALQEKDTEIEGNITAINNKIGEVEEGKTIVGMISDAEYDDTALVERIDGVDDEIDALQELTGNIKDTVDSISSNVYVKDQVYSKTETYNKTEIDTAVSDAEENAVNRVLGYLADEEVNVDYDTLKEVAAWIESDTTNSAALIKRVSDIEADYLKKADKEELQGEIDALGAYVGDMPEGAASETVVAYIHEVVDALKIGDYAKASELTALAGRVDTAEGKITTLEEYVGGKSVSGQIEEAIANKVDKVEGSRLMTDAEGTKLEGIAEGANVNVIDTVDEEQFAIANKHLTLLDVAMGKVTGLSDALAGKVDKVEGSRLLTEDEATKLEKLVLGENGEVSVSGKVAAGNVDGLDAWITARAGTLEGLSENNLSDTLLAKLNGIAEGAQVNAIDTVSTEFTVVGKNLAVNEIAQNKITGLADALAGKVDAEDGYRLISETELERVSKIESGAQVNKIEAVKVGDTLLEIVDKTITIPVGAGLKASDEITVATDGTLGVGEVNVNKLVQTDGEYLVLNGGSAAI